MIRQPGMAWHERAWGRRGWSARFAREHTLRAEFWADHTTNSGIFIRVSNPPKIEAVSSYEVNIFDQRPDPVYGTGAIVDVAKVVPMPKGRRWPHMPAPVPWGGR